MNSEWQKSILITFVKLFKIILNVLSFLSVIQDINVEAFVIDLLFVTQIRKYRFLVLCGVFVTFKGSHYKHLLWKHVCCNDCLVKNGLNKTIDTTF